MDLQTKSDLENIQRNIQTPELCTHDQLVYKLLMIDSKINEMLGKVQS
jgi:hypothetical protein